MTTGIDTLTGTADNDTFNASWNAAADKPLGLLDTIDGGAGIDKLQVSDNATASGTAFTMGGISLTSVEKLTVATTGDFDGLNLSGYTSVTDVTLASQDPATTPAATAHNITLANTQNANITLAAAGSTASTVTGGKAVSVTTPGAVTVSGDALTTVTVKGGAAGSSVTNTGATATTLTAVTFEDMAGATASASGDALTSLTIKNQKNALNITTTNTVSTDMTVNVDNAGYDTTTKALIAGTITTTLAATSVATTATVNSTGINKLALVDTDGTVKTVNATGTGNVTLNLTGTAAVTAFNGSTATGDIDLLGLAATVASVKTGSGKDTVTTTQTAKSAFDMGAGNDTVTVNTNLAAGTKINLGAGNDALLFSGTGAIANTTATETTVIDGGAGTDTLALKLVGAANIGVFTNFEVFDVAGLVATLDTDILAANNTVTEFVGTGDTGHATTATLTNVAAGVNFRATGDMNTNAITLTQKTAGALTVTLDADSTSTIAENDTAMKVVASNATSLKAVFDVDSGYDAPTVNTNDQSIALTGSTATTLEIVSGGTNAINTITYTSADADGAGAGTVDFLTSVTASGSEDLIFAYTPTAGSAITTFDASAMTGGLTFELADLKNGGTVKLGSGTDVVKVAAATAAITEADIESIVGFEKSTSATDADIIKLADSIVITGGASIANTQGATVTTGTIDKGVLTFTGTGPTTLDAAIVIADAAAETAGESVVFEYIGNSYLFVQGTTGTADLTDDFVVKLTGVTGVTDLFTNANSDLVIA